MYFLFQENHTERYHIEEQSLDEHSVNINRNVATPQSNSLRESRHRRSQNLPDLQEANINMKRAFTTLDNVFNKHNSDDDCDLFAKLIANRLRKLPERKRDDIMYKMYGLLHEASTLSRHANNQVVQSPPPLPTPTRASSTQQSLSIITSPQHIYTDQNNTDQDFSSVLSPHDYITQHTQSPSHSLYPLSAHEQVFVKQEPGTAMYNKMTIPTSKRIRILKNKRILAPNTSVSNNDTLKQSTSKQKNYIASTSINKDILSAAIKNTGIYDIQNIPP